MKRPRDRISTVIIAVFAVLAAGITAYQLSRPGFLLGITPDISAWFGGSIRLVHGALPYRDFDLLQPPGFALLASPFAFLSEAIGTRDALAAMRLCTPLLAAGNVLLIGYVVRHQGRTAVIVACAVMAFFPADNFGTIILSLMSRITHIDAWNKATAYLLGPNLNLLASKLEPGRVVRPAFATPMVSVSSEHVWTVVGVYAAAFLVLSIVLLLRRDILE